jgi:hypothetical protein
MWLDGNRAKDTLVQCLPAGKLGKGSSWFAPSLAQKPVLVCRSLQEAGRRDTPGRPSASNVYTRSLFRFRESGGYQAALSTVCGSFFLGLADEDLITGRAADPTHLGPEVER